MSVATDLAGLLAPGGLNVSGVASIDAWNAVSQSARQGEALLPGTRSIVVFGSGGPALWNAFLADLRARPEHLSEEQHPLDRYVRRLVTAADATLGGLPRRWFFAAADETTHLDFRMLAWLAGLGAPSRLGLLLHPVYGPWLGLRAACFTTERLAPTGQGADDACGDCPAPCVTACPGAAFPGGRWSVDACASFKQAGDRCRSACDARAACPIGAEHRYPDVEVAYHSHRATGRAALRELLGIEMDHFDGEGPYWTTWRQRIDTQGKA